MLVSPESRAQRVITMDFNIKLGIRQVCVCGLKQSWINMRY